MNQLHDSEETGTEFQEQEAAREEGNRGISRPADEPEYQGWAGDGTGEDDLADYNQNEADDYRDE